MSEVIWSSKHGIVMPIKRMHVFRSTKLEAETWFLLLSEREELNRPELIFSGLESNVRQQSAGTSDVSINIWVCSSLANGEDWRHSLRPQTFILKYVLFSSKYLGLHNLVSHQMSCKPPWNLSSNSKLKTSWELYSFIAYEGSCTDHGSSNLIPLFEQQ